MKDYLFVFRSEYGAVPELSDEQAQALTKRWMDWIGNIAARNRLTDRGNRLQPAGKVLRANDVITDGPFTEIKEFVGGYTTIKAASLDEAVEMAKGCPIFTFGGSVEVRPVDGL